MPEFHQRIRVLQQLGYVDESRTVTLKGRVTCEINSTQASKGGVRMQGIAGHCRVPLLFARS